MKKKAKLITYNQLVVGLISKFRSVDVSDISVAMLMMGIDEFSSIEYEDIEKYICLDENKRAIFNIDMVKKNYEDIEQFYWVIEKICGDDLKRYLDNLDLFEFMLRKIKLLTEVDVDSYRTNFGELQIFLIEELKRQGYLMVSSHKTVNDGVGSFLSLSKRGSLYLYLIDNKVLIDRFSQELRNNEYDDKLIEAFLIVQDLEKDINDILTVDNFLKFCGVYGLCPYYVNRKSYGRKRVQ